MTNKYTPHLQILPEDDANREFAVGFSLSHHVYERSIQILKPAGGWEKAVDGVTACRLDTYEARHLLLLIDFDDDVANRLPLIKSRIPQEIIDRVFILGTSSEPERLRVELGQKLEEIGRRVADECADNQWELWNNPLVRHNLPELQRLSRAIRGALINT